MQFCRGAGRPRQSDGPGSVGPVFLSGTRCPGLVGRGTKFGQLNFDVVSPCDPVFPEDQVRPPVPYFLTPRAAYVLWDVVGPCDEAKEISHDTNPRTSGHHPRTGFAGQVLPQPQLKGSPTVAPVWRPAGANGSPSKYYGCTMTTTKGPDCYIGEVAGRYIEDSRMMMF